MRIGFNKSLIVDFCFPSLETSMNQPQKKEQRTIESKKKIRDTIHKPLIKDDTNNKLNSDLQKALVLQGGGALAAYEVGVYGMLYFWRKKEIEKNIETEKISFSFINFDLIEI